MEVDKFICYPCARNSEFAGKGYSAYCSTKGGLVLLVRQHAMELAPHGVTVNGVAPTFVNTELIRHVYERPDFRDQILARIPLGRIANPKDVVAPVLFLAAPGAEFITGQVLYVDGGITASSVISSRLRPLDRARQPLAPRTSRNGLT